MTWLPIESAPKDGTEILLFTNTDNDADRFWVAELFEGEHFTKIQIGYWEDAVDHPMRKAPAGWHTTIIGQPTHWMPLPPPPVSRD